MAIGIACFVISLVWLGWIAFADDAPRKHKRVHYFISTLAVISLVVGIANSIMYA